MYKEEMYKKCHIETIIRDYELHIEHSYGSTLFVVASGVFEGSSYEEVSISMKKLSSNAGLYRPNARNNDLDKS